MASVSNQAPPAKPQPFFPYSAPIGPKPLSKCSVCSKQTVEKMKQCSICKKVIYCGVKCQKSAWPIHKTVCYKSVWQHSKATIADWQREAQLDAPGLYEMTREEMAYVEKLRALQSKAQSKTS